MATTGGGGATAAGVGVGAEVRPREREVVPADAVATFLDTGDAARGRVRELARKARAAVAEGGSSSSDLRRLVDYLIQAKAAVVCGAGGGSPP
ncbi:hypothetical protein EJB05_42684, partial [Eragrostis curvula]